MLEFLLGASIWAFRSGELAFARGWPLWLLWALLAFGGGCGCPSPLRAGSSAGCAPRCSVRCRWRSSRWPCCCCGARCCASSRSASGRTSVAVLVDDSGSMNSADAPDTPVRRAQAVAALQEKVLKQVGAHSDLRLFGFSDHAGPVDSLNDLQGGRGLDAHRRGTGHRDAAGCERAAGSRGPRHRWRRYRRQPR